MQWRVDLDGSTVPSREEIGNKARSIALMRSRGLPVPQAFALPVHVGHLFCRDSALPAEAWSAVLEGIGRLERETGLTFGSGTRPLLVSVRSGAAQSMPGMMDTILNLGINDEVEAALAAASGDPAFARDTHRRFLESYARTVLGVHNACGENESPSQMRERLAQQAAIPIPTDPAEQLRGAIEAVFASWQSQRAKAYRKHWNLSEDGGTAVTVQRMVYGNLDERSGTGVLFTRNPHSGADDPLGEFLPRGQGEDVVSGEVDPLDLSALAALLPEVHAELLEAGQLLERDAADVQDVEFTVERGRLFLLQTRNAKRSPVAAVELAVRLAEEGVIDRSTALSRVTAEHVRSLLRPGIDPAALANATVLVTGEPACPGVGQGTIVTSSDDAMMAGFEDRDVILVRHSTSPDDVEGMIAARGICTEVGGRTSHAAVVSRELGRPAVVGCGEGTVTSLAGRTVTVDGAAGVVYDGLLPVVTPNINDHPSLVRLRAWGVEHSDALPPDHPLRPTGDQPNASETPARGA